MTATWGRPDDLAENGTRTRSWGDGYVVDNPYFEPATTDVSPAWLSMMAVLHGQPPLDRTRPLRWLDLGAASGISACMVAAANPDVEVWGVDHNPAHVERARTLAQRARLTDCHFAEASFADLARDRRIGPAEVDVIVVSGVYSWVSAANQDHIRRIIRQRLRPGGIAYLMYECSTGWSSMVPLSGALRLLTAADGRRGDLAFHDAARTVRAMADAGAAYFPIGSHEQTQMDDWPTADPFYASHEYLGDHFGPLSFDEVLGPMEQARCSYLGQLDPTDPLSGYWTPPQFLDMVRTEPDLATREMLRDIIGQRALRRDLYRRGLATMTLRAHEADLHDLVVIGSGKPLDDRPVPVLGGGVALDPVYYRPLTGVLESEPLDGAKILSIHTDWTIEDAAGALALLVAGGHAHPVAPGEISADAVEASRRLTEVLIAENRSGADHSIVVSPMLGTGRAVDSIALLALGEIWDGSDADPEDLARRVIEILGGQGRTIRHENRLLTDEQQAHEVATERIAELIRALPTLGLDRP